MRKKLDTSAKLREVMDRLVLAIVEEADKLKMKDSFDQKLDVVKHVTNYLSMVNKQPEEAEGADILEFRNRLSASAGGGGDTGDGAGDIPEPVEDNPEPDLTGEPTDTDQAA